MTERIKDLIYDFSDILLGLLIIGCMFLVVSWKITGIMDINLDLNEKISSTSPVEIEDKVEYVDGEDIIIVEPVNPPEETPIEKETQGEVTNDENPSREAIEITIDIPKGTTGLGIANILKEKGLINNTNDFISTVEEMNLGSKLRFGTFTIRSDSKVKDIVHIITGIQ